VASPRYDLGQGGEARAVRAAPVFRSTWRARAAAMPATRESLPRRWAHVQGVAARAHSLAPVLGADADLLEAAAWLHDMGYAPGLADTGLHALDGARYLPDTQHADAMLCRLVSATRSNPASTSAAIPCRLQT
jgi:predicted hydrolase (HD superfamily)